MVSIQDSITVYPASFNSTNYSYASIVSGYPATNPVGKGSTNTTMARFNIKTGSSAETYVFYNFDLSAIPSDATINSVTCKAKASISTTSSNRVGTRQVQLFYNNSTAKGSAVSMTTSASALTVTAGTWTRSELEKCSLRLYAKRGSSNTTTTYYIAFYGADLTVTYTYQKNTYVITTSCTDGTVSPMNPEVIEGESQTFKFQGENGDEALTSLTLDGVNVLGQAIRKQALTEGTYSVNAVSGASYGFALSGNYYVSQNKAKATTAALCRVNFELPADATVTFYVINYAEATYDYGMLSNIDQQFGANNSTESTTYWKGNTSALNQSTEQAVVYNMTKGSHTIDVKYYKDSYTDSNNDTLQFRVVIELKEVIADGYYYEYTIPNVTAVHTLDGSFASLTGYVLYLKESGTWKTKTVGTAYKKINGQWVVQSSIPGLFDPAINYVKGN